MQTKEQQQNHLKEPLAACWVKDAFSCGAMLNFPQSVNRKRADLVMAK